MEPIRLLGARQHNLKGIDIVVHPGEVLVMTGPSGAGKSSLALDTLYAEGQRRYVESFSPYARQFLDRSQRPVLAELEACPPAIAVDRTMPARSGRSTVATRTEIADSVKLLYARASTVTCRRCGCPVSSQSPESIATRLTEIKGVSGHKAIVWMPYVCAPTVEGLLDAREVLLPLGFHRALVGDHVRDFDEIRPSDGAHSTDTDGALRIVVDRLVIAKEDRSRLIEALEMALRYGEGQVGIDVEGATVLRTGRGWRCEQCGEVALEPTPGFFSFNSPIGACEECSGFGRAIEIDPNKVIDNPQLSLDEEAIRPFRGPKHRTEQADLRRFCRHQGIPTDIPWRELSKDQQNQIWQGGGTGNTSWYGINAWFEWLESRSYKAHVRIQLARYRRYVPCGRCGGSRFQPRSLDFAIDGLNIASFYRLTCREAHQHLSHSPLRAHPTVSVLVEELCERLRFLDDVGVGYLSLDRMTRTLSGGEAQRVGLATALGASLSGTLFVIDEPTVGLHAADVPRLMAVIKRLAALGNAVIVVDNHPQVVGAADRIADLGPGAGEQGGELVYYGKLCGLASNSRSKTAQLLQRTRLQPSVDLEPHSWAEVVGAAENNLKEIDVRFPLGLMTAVTGVSGSGKSTLVDQIMVRGLHRMRGIPTDHPGAHRELRGFESVGEIVIVDQSPLGRTSRGNPATYVKAWEVLRKRLASQSIACAFGLTTSSFSFNVDGGRCDACQGEGSEIVEMQFLPDVRLPCPVCGGRRFQERVLEVRLDGLNAAEWLDTTVAEVLRIRVDDKPLHRRLQPIAAVGLDYLKLGQPLSTLSDGEAQRLKLARALTTVAPGDLVILDEPTVGLHPADVAPLILVLRRLVSLGTTAIIVTHDLALAASADWLIDLGPGGGDQGGDLVNSGTPSMVARSQRGATAQALFPLVQGHPMVQLSEGSTESCPAEESVAELNIPGISVRGARQHNLKDISVSIPRGKISVVTGPSGSGKSSLTFDVIHAEGQRRYLQSLSTYVRQYLRQLPRPEVDSIDGVPPSIALEPRTATGNTATVATLTEVGHYLRLLFARSGVQRCPDCLVSVQRKSEEELILQVGEILRQQEASLFVRVIEHRKGTHQEVLNRAATLGCVGIRVDGKVYDVSKPPKLARYREHDIDYEIARLELGEQAIAATVSEALRLGMGTVRLVSPQSEVVLSTRRSCPSCGRGFAALDPTFFSFQSPHASCPQCGGTGSKVAYDEEALFDESKPLSQGGLVLFEIPLFRRNYGRRLRRIKTIPLDRRWSELNENQRQALLYGRGRWPGIHSVIAQLAQRRLAAVEGLFFEGVCDECQGSRLAAEPRLVTLGGEDVRGRSFQDVLAMSVDESRKWFEQLRLSKRDRVIAKELCRQIQARLSFLVETGVGYLTLNRRADTLSGGETQRVRLAAQLGAGLTGVCYVLDEPTIGLHHRDTRRLIEILRRLARNGSTVLVVEHDEQTIRAAEQVIDLGPSGGVGGGTIVALGTPRELESAAVSPTGEALAGTILLPKPRRRDVSQAQWLTVRQARERNLKGIDAAFPLKCLTAVTGVSGSGKSTLVRDVLLTAVKRGLGFKIARPPGAHAGLEGLEHLRRAVEVDQSPIGRTPRSVPATYVGIWSEVRRLLSRTPLARARGFGPERFSFNREGGRCELCAGQGSVTVEMNFLPNVEARCEACGGSRFEPSTREVTFRGLSVDRILNLTISEALEVFETIPKILAPLRLLCDLGVGYLTLGQPSNTLSGGEAQRLKLATELQGNSHGKALYVLDEPTTGLHAKDVMLLINVLQRLVELGDTVIVIEHHLDVIWAADHVIDLGPEGGDGGGEIIKSGSPPVIRACQSSATGQALAQSFAGSNR